MAKEGLQSSDSALPIGQPSEGSGVTGAASFDSQHHRILGVAWGLALRF